MLDMAKVTIGEKSYILRYPLKAMVKAETLLGKPLQSVFVVDKESKLPVAKLEDLVPLFILGLKAEQPNISDEQAEDLLSQFLSEGVSIVAQTATLYCLIGKALGFWRTEIDIQAEMNKKIEDLMESRKLSKK